MIKLGDEFIQVVTKYDRMTAVIKEPYFLALAADDSIWPEIGIREGDVPLETSRQIGVDNGILS